MEQQTELNVQEKEKKPKKVARELAASAAVSSAAEISETKAIVKIIFDGEAAVKILKCEAELKERLSKPDMGKIIGNEILSWTEKRWVEIVEENTDIDYFFAQIRKSPDKSKSIKLLKDLSEKLRNEDLDAVVSASVAPGLFIGVSEELKNSAG